MNSDSTPQISRWEQLSGGNTGKQYADRFAELAASGKDMHGEASLCASLVAAGARILDAGCGTGRVAIRLAELGYACTGVDADDSMLTQARLVAPELPWVLADLSTLALPDPPFDLVVAAGNVVPLLAPGTLSTALSRLAAYVAPGGLLVSGFGLDAAHLPPGCPVTSLADYDAACRSEGLVPIDRWETWDRQPLGEKPGYVVAVHQKP